MSDNTENNYDDAQLELIQDYMKNVDSSINLINTNENIKDYNVISQIGIGGFSTVYLCRKKTDNTEIAIKRIVKKLNGKKIKNFRSKMEIFIQHNITHPKIVKCNGWFEDRIYMYIILDYIKGYDLYEKTINFATPIDKKIIWLKQIIDILIFLKSKHIIHCDLKMENILIDQDDNVYLCDFGLSRFENDKLLKLIINNSKFIGTYEYFSPEIFKDNDYSYFSDVWAFGVIMYELMYGIELFTANNNSNINGNSNNYDRNMVEYNVTNYIVNYNNDKEFDEINSVLKKIFVPKSQRITIEELEAHQFFNIIDNIHNK